MCLTASLLRTVRTIHASSHARTSGPNCLMDQYTPCAFRDCLCTLSGSPIVISSVYKHTSHRLLRSLGLLSCALTKISLNASHFVTACTNIAMGWIYENSKPSVASCESVGIHILRNRFPCKVEMSTASSRALFTVDREHVSVISGLSLMAASTETSPRSDT